MEDPFDEQKLQEKLCVVPIGGQLIFALSCAERMLPNYQRFVQESDFGDVSVLRCALNLGWDWLSGKSIDLGLAEKCREDSENQAPNTEDFSTILVSSALDAANAASIVVDFLLTSNLERVVELATYARDSVDMFVQELEKMQPNARNLEEKIWLHPLMQRELANQRNALTLITDGITLSEAIARWRSPLMGSLDL